MILAGFVLLAVGAADLVRQFAPRRWIGYLAAGIILLLLGSVSDALLPMIAGLVIGTLWVWTMPSERPAPLGFWPAVLLAPVAPDTAADLDDRADRRIGELRDRSRQAGHATGHPGHVGVATFMTGVAGIAFGRVLVESGSSATGAVDLPDPIALRPSRLACEG